MAYEVEDYDLLMMTPASEIDYGGLDSALLTRLALSEDPDIAASSLRELSRRASPNTHEVARSVLLREADGDPFLLGVAWTLVYDWDRRLALDYLEERVAASDPLFLEAVMSVALADRTRFIEVATRDLISAILRRVEPSEFVIHDWMDPRIPEDFRDLFRDR